MAIIKVESTDGSGRELSLNTLLYKLEEISKSLDKHGSGQYGYGHAWNPVVMKEDLKDVIDQLITFIKTGY